MKRFVEEIRKTGYHGKHRERSAHSREKVPGSGVVKKDWKVGDGLVETEKSSATQRWASRRDKDDEVIDGNCV